MTKLCTWRTAPSMRFTPAQANVLSTTEAKCAADEKTAAESKRAAEGKAAADAKRDAEENKSASDENAAAHDVDFIVSPTEYSFYMFTYFMQVRP
jgi:membrane protein involved in colicin uptake